MILNYFKVIKRNLLRHPMHAILNLSCLTIGIAGVLLILLYLQFELTYDTYHEKAARIYRIDTKEINTHERTMEVNWTGTPAPLAPTAQQELPGIESYTRFFQFWTTENVGFRYGGDIIEESAVYAADASVSDVFTLEPIEGDMAYALSGPNRIMLSEGLAERIFGDGPALGEVIDATLSHGIRGYPEKYPLLVTGIYRDLPKNVHLLPRALISADTDAALEDYYYNRFNMTSYLLLERLTEPSLVAPRLSSIYTKYLDPAREPVMKYAGHRLTPIRDIHIEASGGYAYIYIFGAVGMMLLAISAISYINLATAQATKRALEIGIRKVMGSQRSQLSMQFLCESLLFTIVALLLAIAVLIEGIPYLNGTLRLALAAEQLSGPAIIIGILAIVFILGILGGSYPAFFLTGLEPLRVIKGKVGHKVPLRKTLVAIQLGAVIFIIGSTGMIYEQLRYISDKDLGFDKEHVVGIDLPSGEGNLSAYNGLRDVMSHHPSIKTMGRADFIPGNAGMTRRPIAIDGSPNQEQRFVYSGRIDEGFFGVMDIGLLDGRNFSTGLPADTSSIIVNERLVEVFGLKRPIGDRVRFGGKGNPKYYTIIGVVKDFHQGSLYTSIGPQIFTLREPDRLYVRLGEDIPKGLRHIEESWGKVFRDRPLTLGFIEEGLQDGYVRDRIKGKLFLLLAVFTISTAFLGLFGLSSYLATQRIKEIGIRKVLGASVMDVVVLITRDFILLTLLAAVPAFILSWYVIEQWLTDFAFRTDIDHGIYAAALVSTLLLTFVTTGLHAFRAASVDPLKNLRYE